MTHENKDDAFLEKVILILVVIIGAGIFYKQLFFIEYSPNTFLNTISLLLLLSLAFFIAWAFIDKSEKKDKEEISHHKEVAAKTERKHFTFFEKLTYSAVGLAAVLILFNQFQISQVSALSHGSPSSGSFINFVSSALGSNSNGATIKLGKFEFGSKITLKPMPLASGEQPAISGYKTKVKPIPTISELSLQPSTGDVAKDLLNNIIPTGTPWYGQEAGVSFDDPILAQKKWGKYRALQLSHEENQRWNKIANSFTCDYCCGSPQNPTIITRCGCAHSIAAQGMAKWFVKNYGDKFTDEEIYGEMGRWYALWYPGPTIKRIAEELRA